MEFPESRLTLYFKALSIMVQNAEHDLAHIRQMMERSTRFISLSGLAGVFAGLIALAATAAAIWIFKMHGTDYFTARRVTFTGPMITQLFLVCILTLILSVGQAIYLTHRKSKKQQAKMWTTLTARLLTSFAIPLVAGGIFCLALWYHNHMVFVAPVMLIFYGLALVNASKYTYTDVAYLGYSELVLGLAALFLTGYGLLFWAIGFGVLHIIYGLVMYRKYDQAG